jgi:hypothetical protein
MKLNLNTFGLGNFTYCLGMVVACLGGGSGILKTRHENIK